MCTSIFVLVALATAAVASGQDVTVLRGSTAAEDLMIGLIDNFSSSGNYEYQAEGSGAGQDYITNGDGTIGLGDVPFPQAVDGVYQLPFAVGAISIYANLGGEVLNEGITAEQVCGIYDGTITSWQDIAPELPDVAPMPIGRRDSSGSTAVFTEWLIQACSTWGPGQGKTVEWGSTVTQMDDTSGILEAITATEGAIGYASCGREGNGRQELPVVNASGKPVLCESADYSTLSIEVPASADEDWSAANPVNLEGDTSYPMPFLLFAYMPADLSPFGTEGQAAVDLMTFILGPDGQTLLGDYTFFAPPADVLALSQSGLDALSGSAVSG